MFDFAANFFPRFSSSRKQDATVDAKATSQDTPRGGDAPVSWVVLAAKLPPIEATIMKGRLETMQIPAIIQQESIGSVMGLTVGPLSESTVLVPDSLLEAAHEVVVDEQDGVSNDDESEGASQD